jgi:antirestriction protein ArdC
MIKKQSSSERRQQDRERLEQAVAALVSSEGWKSWVETRSRFHRYSLHNQFLIAMQKPDATQVAGYKTWQSLGRQVRKSEKGIRILAPMPVKRQMQNDEEETFLLFRSVAVFDVSQTDGEPLPEIPGEPVTGDSHAEYLPKLEAYAGSLGLVVVFEEVRNGAKGYHSATAHSIGIDSRMAPNEQVAVLVHELAHALGDINYCDYPREVAEVIVETTAYIVCRSIGLETDSASVPYLASWAGVEPRAIRQYAETIDGLASSLEEACGLKGVAA